MGRPGKANMDAMAAMLSDLARSAQDGPEPHTIDDLCAAMARAMPRRAGGGAKARSGTAGAQVEGAEMMAMMQALVPRRGR